ncbi:MAG: carboxypeptidase-like regulatory domain-containing protein, partial [Solirubrobacteraceae bacterium]
MKLYFSLLFILPFFAWAQDGTITGYCTGKSQEPLAGITISIEGTNLNAISNEKGFYSISNVKPGTYNFTASGNDYLSFTLFNIIVKSVGNAEINFSFQEKTNTLEEIVVKKSKIKRLKETPLSIQSLSAVEIANIPGSNNDVVRAAQSLPGISPSPGGFRNDLIIRGGAPNETVYYLDGMEIPNINHFSTQGSSGGPVGMLNISFIEDVTLSTSSFGAQYDNPLSGVLQFKQR